MESHMGVFDTSGSGAPLIGQAESQVGVLFRSGTQYQAMWTLRVHGPKPYRMPNAGGKPAP